MTFQFPGIIKGTPLPTPEGLFTPSGTDKQPICVTLMDGTTAVISPSFVTWKWIRSITFIRADSFTLKVAPATSIVSSDKILQASTLKKDMLLDTLNGSLQIKDVNTYHVLSPVCCMLFPEPVFIQVKGVFVQFPSKSQRKDLINECFKTRLSEPDSECL